MLERREGTLLSWLAQIFFGKNNTNNLLLFFEKSVQYLSAIILKNESNLEPPN